MATVKPEEYDLFHEGFVTFHRYLTSKVTSTIPDSGMFIFLNNHEIKQKYTIILGMSNGWPCSLELLGSILATTLLGESHRLHPRAFVIFRKMRRRLSQCAEARYAKKI